jgi:hypothetical protein
VPPIWLVTEPHPLLVARSELGHPGVEIGGRLRDSAGPNPID